MIKIKKIHLLNYFIKLFTTIIILLILIEGLLSLFKIGPVEKFLGWGYNPECCGDLRPNQKITAQVVANHPYFIQTNSLGLRDTDEVSLIPNKKRILAIGDSMTFGPYVANEETWPAYLEEKFENNIEVLNAGIPAYSIIEETAYLKEKGHLLQSDLIILQFYVNDISDVSKNKTRMVRKSAFSNYKYLYKILNFLRDRSHLFALLADQSLKRKIDQNIKNATNFQGLSEDNFSQELYDEFELTFNELIEFVKKNKLRLAVIIIPDLAQSKDLSLTKSANFIQDLCFKNDIPVLNLQPMFYQANQIENLFLVPWNEHLSKDGNKLVAKETSIFLIQNNLLD